MCARAQEIGEYVHQQQSPALQSRIFRSIADAVSDVRSWVRSGVSLRERSCVRVRPNST